MKELIKELKFWEMSHKLTSTDREDLRTIIGKMEKQLTIPVVSKSFASGVKVQIEDCINGHEFGMGEIVTLIEERGNQWLARGFDGTTWYINEEEAYVC